jgi:hypothetical protein
MPHDAPDAEEDLLTKWMSALEALERPVTDEEAVALLSCFPHDDGTVFGLAWSLPVTRGAGPAQSSQYQSAEGPAPADGLSLAVPTDR